MAHTIVTVEIPGNKNLTHDVTLTGYTQTSTNGKVYHEGIRTDNGLYEMIPSAWMTRFNHSN